MKVPKTADSILAELPIHSKAFPSEGVMACVLLNLPSRAFENYASIAAFLVSGV